MKKALVPSLGLIWMLASCSGSKKAEADSETQVNGTSVQAIVIDGKANDWQKVPMNVSPKGTIQYAIANSQDNLYIMMRLADPVEQVKLLQGGMQVYIDPDGKKEKTTEVVYPVKGELSEEEMRPQGVPGQKQDLTQIHQHVASQLISLNRIGFKPEYNGVQSVRENTGFKAAINWDENNDLVYELVVPYAAFPSS